MLARTVDALLRRGLGRDGVDLEALVQAFERPWCAGRAGAADGNQTRAARLLGLNRDKFRYRLKQYGIG